MTIKDNVMVLYSAWKMNCPTPRAYRAIKRYIQALNTTK